MPSKKERKKKGPYPSLKTRALAESLEKSTISQNGKERTHQGRQGAEGKKVTKTEIKKLGRGKRRNFVA